MKTGPFLRYFLVLWASACVNTSSKNADQTSDGQAATVMDTPSSPAAVNPPAFTDTLPTGKLIDPVVCRSDAGQSYALYIPPAEKKGPLPVIYFFDPHADGALPLLRYRALADENGFILAGSNNSKNGNDGLTTEHIWEILSADLPSRVHADKNRIYTCGFSGGAKVAGLIALQHPEVKGVIAGGAGLPDGTPAGEFAFCFTAMAGDGDMNLTELVALNNDLDRTHTRHHILFFEGKHEWAPAPVMSVAFTGLQLDAMGKGLIPKNQALLDRFTEKSKKTVDDDCRAGQWLRADQTCSLSASYLDGLSAASAWFVEKAASIRVGSSYQKQRQEQQKELANEEMTKAMYRQHFQDADPSYWARTIDGLQQKAAEKTPDRGMYQRLLAYLSLAFYSISNHLILAGENEEAAHFVELYKTADPTNSEAWYFSALLHARAQQAQAASDDLDKAVANGFNDKDRLMKQPEFQSLSGQINLPLIESKMKAASP